MSFMKMSKIYPKKLSPESVHKIYRWSEAIKELTWSGVEVIFVDEFSLSSRPYKQYGCSRIGYKALFLEMADVFSWSFVVRLSQLRFYPVYGTNGTFNASAFVRYLESIIKYRRDLNLHWSDWIICCDNASIHKASLVKDFMKTSGVKILFITTYSPWLNPVELLHLLNQIKAGVKQKTGKVNRLNFHVLYFRVLSLATKKKVVYEILSSDSENFLQKSQQETRETLRVINLTM